MVTQHGLYDSNGAIYADENTAYNANKAHAATVATTMAPYGINTYEAGNELTRDKAIIIDSRTAGNKPTDFNNANWPILRGMIDGVKSVQSTARVSVNFCVADIAASDMLWDGFQPNGTTWHNYQAYGDIFSVGTDGSGPGFNLPAYVKARYGKPFWLTEWNSVENSSTTDRAAYIQSKLPEFYNARKIHGIESTMLYELISGNDLSWGIVRNNLLAVQPEYGVFQTFVKQHSDN